MGIAPMTTPCARPLYIRPSQAQQVFGIHRSTLYRWAQTGAFRIFRRGSVSLVRVEDVERFIESDRGQFADAERG